MLEDKLMVIGDTHFSDTFKGTHINYKESGIRLMRLIIDKVKEEKPSHLVFAGDFIGVQEKSIRSRLFFLEIIKFLQELNKLTENNVYIIFGNHDIGSYSVTDVALLVELGLFKHVDSITFNSLTGKSYPLVKFHLVDYGMENEPLELTYGQSNVVIGHNNFAFNNDSLYGGQAGIVLANHTNWEGVDLVISGHIHVPSHEIVSGRIGDKVSNLFILGAPCRVAERIEDCWYVIFEREGQKNFVYEAKPFGLWSVEEEFLPKVEEGEEEKEKSIRDKNLRGIIQELNESRLMQGGLFEQIERFPMVSQEVKERAKEILGKVMN